MILGALIVVSLAVLLVAISAPVPWPVKAALIVASFAVDFVVWSAAGATAGWPAPVPLPAKDQFVSCVVEEPAPAYGVAGAVYLWLVPLDEHAGIVSYRPKDPLEPRAYSEPYSEGLQAACQAAQKIQLGGGEAGLARSSRNSKQHGAVNDPGRYHAYILPRPNPPAKEHHR